MGVLFRFLILISGKRTSRLSMERDRSFYIKLSIYMVLSFMSVAVSYLTIRMLTHRLTPEQNAYEGLIYSIVYFLNPALSFSATGLFTIKKVQLCATEFVEYKKRYYGLVFRAFLLAWLSFLI